jgi:hypothetical protein
VVFNNYEAVQSYFPLKWNTDLGFLLFDAFHKRKDHDAVIRRLKPDFVVVQQTAGKELPAVLGESRYISVFHHGEYELYKHH